MTATLRCWLTEPMPMDVRVAIERLCEAEDITAVAVMPDVHLGDQVCVGVALATTSTLYPNAVGGDIGCGMATVPLSVRLEDIDNPRSAAAILAGWEQAVPILAHHHDQDVPDDINEPLQHERLPASARRLVARQLGTLGRGNHFLELQVDEAGQVWLAVHVGSRGVGQLIRDQALAQGRACPHTGLVGLQVDSGDGQRYLHNVAWAMSFADHNRRRILSAAMTVLADVAGASPVWSKLIRCDHNHVECSHGQWIHRKGALHADVHATAIIPGSMGTHSYHVAGRGHAEALWSSSHGAGRRWSRTEARRRVKPSMLQRDIAAVWYDVRKLSQLVDEAPAAYKDIDQVMRAQRQLTKVVSVLTPLLSYKGV
jgi:tRNA-splicing ligase RtcB (3'-phosphate/5'-hydroxy nucleic acid ligase)